MQATNDEEDEQESRFNEVSNFFRHHHALVLYAFGAFILVRMWFFAFAKKDSKLISFCAFVMLVALYLWWSRRRSQLAANSLSDLPTTVNEATLTNAQAQRHDGGVTLEGKQHFVRFQYEGSVPPGAMITSSPTVEPKASDEERNAASGSGDESVGATEEKVDGPAAAAPPSPAAAATVEPENGGATNGKVLEEVFQYVDQHCSICLCEYEQGEELCMLPCHHAFHDLCISVWVTNHSKCPLCLRDLNNPNSFASPAADQGSPPASVEEESGTNRSVEVSQ